MALPKLPDELWLCIAQKLDQDRDISSLACCSRKLYGYLDGYLYRHSVERYGDEGLICAARHGRELPVMKFVEAGPISRRADAGTTLSRFGLPCIEIT
jgi:hypothetical protein